MVALVYRKLAKKLKNPLIFTNKEDLYEKNSHLHKLNALSLTS